MCMLERLLHFFPLLQKVKLNKEKRGEEKKKRGGEGGGKGICDTP